MLKLTVVCVMLAAAFAQHQDLAHEHDIHQEHGQGSNDVASHHHTGNDAHAKTLSASSNVHHDGFDYHFETSNGISAKASGDSHGGIHGEFAWTSPEGTNVALSYVADENGYQPSSPLLPTPPPIPEAILKSLEYIASHPSKEDDQHDHEHDHHSHEHHSQDHHDHDHEPHEQPLINIRRF